MRTMVKIAALGLTMLLVGALLATGAAAAPMQATPEECQIGQICNPDEVQTDLPAVRPTGSVEDAAGATLRTIIMLSIMAVLFLVYLLWAFGRGTTPAG